VTRIAIWVAAAALGAFFVPAPDAHAASFDCATATSREAQAICQLPGLSDMDARIATAYAAALQRLTPAGQRILKETQDQWSEAMIAGCAPVRDDPDKLPACLERPYKMRLYDLTDPISTIGDFTFLRVSAYAFVPCLDEFGCDAAFGGGYVHASHPGIDAPANDQIRQWNRLVLDKLPPLAGALQPNTNVTLDFEIAGVSADMISVRFDLREYSHRASHGSAFVFGLNTILSTGRQIAAGDLFVDKTPWQDYLYRQAARQARASLGAQAGQIMPEVIHDIVNKPERWAITPAGLAILFAPNDLGFYTETPRAAVIPWADLKPFLRSPLPFQLPQ
jgi:uncharacterized protein YecT (DUF1311 family)